MPSHIQEVLKNLGDAKVQSISWRSLDVVIELLLPDDYRESLRLRFADVSALSITWDFGAFSGAPMLFSADAKAVDDLRWRVRFDFGVAPDGHIEFECSDVLSPDDS